MLAGKLDGSFNKPSIHLGVDETLSKGDEELGITNLL
jgi:hypothetical protein